MDSILISELERFGMALRSYAVGGVRDLLTLHGDGLTTQDECLEFLKDWIRPKLLFVELEKVRQSSMLDKRLKNLLTKYLMPSEGMEDQTRSNIKPWDKQKFLRMRAAGVTAADIVENWIQIGCP